VPPPHSDSADTTAKVRYRRVHPARLRASRVLAVFCARQGKAVELAECSDCPHCRGLCVSPGEDTFLRCSADDAEIDIEVGGPIEEDEASRQTLLSDVMTTPVRTVAPETSIAELLKLFDSAQISAVPVVDPGGRAVGLVSKSDLLAGLDDDGSPAATRVQQVMSHNVFALRAEASVSRAAAMMAYEGIHRLVVLDGAGHVAGLVSSLDILRWLARRDGYVVPERTRRQSEAPAESDNEP